MAITWVVRKLIKCYYQVTEAICERGTRISGTKGEIIGDMESFVRHSYISFVRFPIDSSTDSVRFFDPNENDS